MDNLNETTSQTIFSQSSALAQAVVERHYGMEPGTWSAYGPPGREKSLRDAGYHLSYLGESVASGDPALFADYIAWVKVLFNGLGFKPGAVPATLDALEFAVRAQLAAPQAALAVEHIQAARQSLEAAPTEPPIFIHPALPLGGLARDYLDALLLGDRQTASKLILGAVERGVTVKNLYLHVFQRTQYEIGRLWQINRLSVAQEHFCTAATQMIMSQLYPHIFSTQRVNRRMVATCVGTELHEIGMRMVADFFEMEGWDTYYLGANMPAENVVNAVIEHRAHVLGISATITFHVSEVAALIEKVRATEHGKNVKILVGGYPFIIAENLWKAVGADGFGRDAQHAIEVANQLVNL